MSTAGALGYVAAGALLYADSILIRPKRGIKDIVAQVTLEEIHRDETKITEHPIEIGANIADHAYELPASLIVRYGWSNSPSAANVVDAATLGAQGTGAAVQSLITGNSADQVRSIYQKLLDLKKSRQPFDVYTGKRKYSNMLIESIAVTTDKMNEHCLVATITLREVLLVSVAFASTGAPAANQAAPSSTAAPVNSGAKVLVPSTSFNAAGGGRGF